MLMELAPNVYYVDTGHIDDVERQDVTGGSKHSDVHVDIELQILGWCNGIP